MLTTTSRGERRTTESTVTHLDGGTASVYAPRGWEAYTEFRARADVPQAVS